MNICQRHAAEVLPLFIKEEEDFAKTTKVRCEVARPLLTL